MIRETKNQLIFRSFDDTGSFEVRIHKSGKQIQLKTEVGIKAIANTNLIELREIRDMINEIIE